MKVSFRIAMAYFLVSMALGAGVALFVYSHKHTAGYREQLAIGLAGTVALIAASGAAIHYQQSLQRAKENLDQAQRLAGIGSWERELSTGKGYWSENHYRLFGLSPAATAPDFEAFLLLIHEDDRERVRRTVKEAIATGKDYEIDYRLADRENPLVFRTRGRLLTGTNGTPTRIIGSVQDITEKHRQEQAREYLLKQKELFITRLGHDLKTPLTPLVGLLPLIRSREMDDRQRELIEICVDSARNIQDLVEKTIKLARFSSLSPPHVTIADISLALAAEDAISQESHGSEQQGVTIDNRIDEKVTVRASRLDLTEVFRQLISNAVKFSRPSSQVVIHALEENEQVTVIVRDNGVGLRTEELPQVFDEFFKADQARHELSSSGLGLAICRRVIEYHGGHIWAESGGPGQGTDICFTLPSGAAI